MADNSGAFDIDPNFAPAPGASGLQIDPSYVAPPPAAAAPMPGHPMAGSTQPNSAWPSLTDVGRNIGTGLVNAMTGVARMMPNPDAAVGLPQLTPEQQRDRAFNTLGLTEYQPSSFLGRRGQDLATAIPAAAIAGPAALPGIAGGAVAAGTANEVAPGHPLLSAGAALLGGTLASRATNLGTAVTGLRTPAGGTLPPEDAALGQTAQNYGIPLNIAQVSRSAAAKYAYSLTSKMPFSGAEPFADAQRGAWTRAVSNQFGEDSDKITPDVLDAARTRIGGVFNSVAQNTTIPMSNQFLTDLQGVVTRARVATSSDTADAANRAAMNMIDTAANNGGNIGGRAYIDLTAKGGPLDDLMQSGDPGRRQVGGWLRDTLDNHFQQAAAPDDAAALQNARSQWKAMRTVQPLTLRADTPGGATPSTGDISPAALRSAVNQSYKNAAFAPLGQIPLNDLAKVGQRFLKDPGSSGTAERWALGSMGAVALEALHTGVNPVFALGTPLAAMAGSRLTNAALRSQMLARQTIAGSLNPNGFRFGAIPPPISAPYQITP